MAKLFVFKKIAQSARDHRSHLCANGYTLPGFAATCEPTTLLVTAAAAALQ